MSSLDTSGAPPPVEAGALRKCLGAFVTGVTVITARDLDGKPVGMTVNSFSSVSLDPPLILWSLRLEATYYPVFSIAERFVVNILAEDQVDVSNRFAKSYVNRFGGQAYHAGLGDLPLLSGCAAHLECRTEAVYPGGDHAIFLGRVERISTSDKAPLAFGKGRYMVVAPQDVTVHNTNHGAGNVAALNAVHRARPVLEDLGFRADKTVGLGVWGNHGPTLIWWAEAKQPLDVQLRAGMVVPVLHSSTGQVFAAFSDPELTAPFIEAELRDPGITSSARPLTSATDVAAMLDRVRTTRLGSIHDVVLPGINERGVNAFSAPVLNEAGEVVLALTMMGAAPCFTSEDPAVALLRQSAETLSSDLGWEG